MIYKKIIFFCCLAIGLVLSGCKKKEVQLPLIDIPGISEIQNHSSIWVFLEKENGNSSARLNKNNKILNTHWIFNIDRSLKMRDVVPILIEMQENRNKDSMHKKEGMLNYFSYADTYSKKISLTPFEATSYTIVSSASDTIASLSEIPCTAVLEILEDQVRLNNKLIPIASLADEFSHILYCDDEDPFKVILLYTDQIPYQDYLETKVYLNKNRITCDSTEYLYSVK